MSVTTIADAPRKRAVLFSFLFAVLALVAFSVPVQAQQNDVALNAALSDLNARSFKTKTAAVQALGVLGDTRAVRALEALSEGRLYGRKSDNVVVIGGSRWEDLSTDRSRQRVISVGEVTSREIKKIVANNKLRGLIRGVLGQLALSSPDRELRRAAVENVIARPTDDSLALLKSARDRETDDDIRARLETGIADSRAGFAGSALRSAAVSRLADGNDPEIKSLLERRLLNNGGWRIRGA